MKFIIGRTIVAAGVFSLLALPALAQIGSEDDSGTVNVTVLEALTITAPNLTFEGLFVANTAITDTILGNVSVTGQNNEAVVLTIDQPAITLTNGADNMAVTMTVTGVNPVTLSELGSGTIEIQAALAAQTPTLSGLYTGTYTVTIDYQDQEQGT